MHTEKSAPESSEHCCSAATSVERVNIQRKLTVGAEDDPLEEEADSVSDTVMRMPDPNLIQRKCNCEEKEEAQRKPAGPFIQKKGNQNSPAASNAVSRQVQSTRGQGSAMDSPSKHFMETRFGADFSGVRIHTGDYAVQLSRELNAQAFTVGNDIYFNNGKYSPESDEGKRLLAHELTHTLQQGNGSTVRKKTEEKRPCTVHAYDNSNIKDKAVVPTDGSGIGVSSVPDMITQVNNYVDKPENHCSCVSRLEINGHGTNGYQSVGNGNAYVKNDKAIIFDSSEEHLKSLQNIKFCSPAVFMLQGCHVGSGSTKGQKLLSRLSKLLPNILIGGAQHYAFGTGAGKKKVVGEGDAVNPDFTVKDPGKGAPFLTSPYVTWYITIDNKEYKILGADVNTEDNNAKLKKADKIKVKTEDGIFHIK